MPSIRYLKDSDLDGRKKRKRKRKKKKKGSNSTKLYFKISYNCLYETHIQYILNW